MSKPTQLWLICSGVGGAIAPTEYQNPLKGVLEFRGQSCEKAIAKFCALERGHPILGSGSFVLRLVLRGSTFGPFQARPLGALPHRIPKPPVRGLEGDEIT